MTDAAVLTAYVLVIVAPVPHLMALWILHRAASRGTPIMALSERRGVALAGFIQATIITLLIINGLLGRPIPLEPPWSQVVTGFALVINAVPAAVFLVLYQRGWFGGDEDSES